ncbi:hypothetical protein [Tenggerimyces flavus]|uniref:ESX-1 secretion-associated protein n=1 Tax=Tenggerimyces flavus TaxID=1708749 RepID=A0ABV7YRJ0_9ACTN|nr:hypothetical protein [Tenggerimyces flavus]MBM7790395.1 hypothetical protein [Tenggerimyces flavus]
MTKEINPETLRNDANQVWGPAGAIVGQCAVAVGALDLGSYDFGALPQSAEVYRQYTALATRVHTVLTGGSGQLGGVAQNLKRIADQAEAVEVDGVGRLQQANGED